MDGHTVIHRVELIKNGAKTSSESIKKKRVPLHYISSSSANIVQLRFCLFADRRQRWRPVTWFRKKGWPVLDLYFCNSFGSSMAGHAIRLSIAGQWPMCTLTKDDKDFCAYCRVGVWVAIEHLFQKMTGNYMKSYQNQIGTSSCLQAAFQDWSGHGHWHYPGGNLSVKAAYHGGSPHLE